MGGWVVWGRKERREGDKTFIYCSVGQIWSVRFEDNLGGQLLVIVGAHRVYKRVALFCPFRERSPDLLTAREVVIAGSMSACTPLPSEYNFARTTATSSFSRSMSKASDAAWKDSPQAERDMQATLNSLVHMIAPKINDHTAKGARNSKPRGNV